MVAWFLIFFLLQFLSIAMTEFLNILLISLVLIYDTHVTIFKIRTDHMSSIYFSPALNDLALLGLFYRNMD